MAAINDLIARFMMNRCVSGYKTKLINWRSRKNLGWYLKSTYRNVRRCMIFPSSAGVLLR